MVKVKAYKDIDPISEKTINKIKIDTESTIVIPFKNWARLEKNQKIYRVPIEYCRFRLENGRIKSQIRTHENLNGHLDPNDEETQKIIFKCLGKSDTNKNQTLKNVLKSDGQTDPAVITADGFLINGNRRKWALESLLKESPEEKFKTMKVVILPGTEDPERPTIVDIALLENRYQLKDTGKSEYSLMNKALTYYENMEAGIKLEELLLDDANFNSLNDRDFKRKMKQFKIEFIDPIELVMQYLSENKIDGDFEKMSHRWSSFQELNKKVLDRLKDERVLLDHKLEENDIGMIKAVGFNLIKMRDIKSLGHQNRDLVRDILDWAKIDKKELFKIGKLEEVSNDITDPDERDHVWHEKNQEKLIHTVKKLSNISNREEERNDPLERLDEALKKLHHKQLDIDKLSQNMPEKDRLKALSLCNEIKTQNDILKSFFFNLNKKEKEKLEKLAKKNIIN